MRNKSCCSNEEKVTKIMSELKVPGQKGISYYDYNDRAVKSGGEKETIR